MAYCVHCGVKLGEAESRCPLCQTPAHDPMEVKKDIPEKPFPVRTPDQTLALNRKYALGFLSVLLLVPAAVCLLLDILSGGLSWSIYPAGVLLLIWIAVAVPLLFRKHRLYSTIVITGISLAGYLRLVELFSNTEGWFTPIVLPALAVFVTILCLIIHLIRRRGLRGLNAISLSLFLLGMLTLVIELLCLQAGVGGQKLRWSVYTMAPCFFISLLFVFIVRNKPIHEELRRRFHF